MEYDGILLCGTTPSLSGRILSLPRLRTAAARAGYNILTADYLTELTQDEIIELLRKHITSRTKFIGFSLTWWEEGSGPFASWANEDIIARIRSLWPSLLIITGNQINKVYIKSDYQFHGMSDYSFVEFLKKLDGKPHSLFVQRPLGSASYKYVIDSNSSNPVNNLDDTSTEFILEDDVYPHDTLPLEVSRGCVFTCAFCRYPFQGKKHNEYIRSAESIATEIRRNYDLFGVTRYNVMDSTFNDNMYKLELMQRALDIAKLPKPFEFNSFIKPEMLVTKGEEMIPRLIDLGMTGAFFGIESLKNSSRRAMNKGMAIEKILDMSYKLVEDSKSKVKLCASMIIGLPDDTPDDIHRTRDFFIKEQDKLFKQWLFYALDLRTVKTDMFAGTESEMEKDPAKYGYEIAPGGVTWKNKHMTYSNARSLMHHIRKADSGQCKAGGWSVPMGWLLNKTEQELIDLPVGRYWNDYLILTKSEARRRYINAMNR
jgi:hypothetical protein